MKPLAPLSLLFATILFSGCVNYAPTLPENYNGPVATVRDSALVHSSSKVDFFVVIRVDGKTIEDSLTHTSVENYGKGMSMTPLLLDHALPAERKTTIQLMGRTSYAAPIQALTSAVYEVKGEIVFTPEPEHIYAVKGELAEDYSAVWLEDTTTQTQVGDKIEVQGSAKVGFWSK